MFKYTITLLWLAMAAPLGAVDTLRVSSSDPVLEGWRWKEFNRSDGLARGVQDIFEDRSQACPAVPAAGWRRWKLVEGLCLGTSLLRALNKPLPTLKPVPGVDPRVELIHRFQPFQRFETTDLPEHVVAGIVQVESVNPCDTRLPRIGGLSSPDRTEQGVRTRHPAFGRFERFRVEESASF